MSYFATEFRVRADITQAKFAALAIAWARGMKNSELFSSDYAEDMSSDHALIMSESGETFALKKCLTKSGFVEGARYERTDADGLLWRSEIVLTNKGSAAALRVKAQCLSTTGNSRPKMPKKPYFVKMAIDDGWTVDDGAIPLADYAHSALALGSDFVSQALLHGGDNILPIIYLSAPFQTSGLNPDDISRYAFQMGGVAHIVVEPDRDFSSELMEKTGGRNPYGGTMALISPSNGVITRLYKGGKFSSDQDVLQAMCLKATDFISSKQAVFGWDWNDLLEETARQLRDRVSDSSEEHDTWQTLVQDQLKEKDEEILRLRRSVEELQSVILDTSNEDGNIISPEFSKVAGKEIYRNEFSDRIRFALSCVTQSGAPDLDERTLSVASKFLRTTQYSGGAKSMISRIKNCGNDSGKADARLIQILEEIGFTKRIDGGHPVLTPDPSLEGLKPQTFSNSPSDHRAGKNKASQIIKGLHLRKLDCDE
ncbi:hypothetical protein [Tropicibacter oceani]|uniref:Uncharacterized protein n=1 Tax=Tropicibacter oceani TaxID=3058420 RepID=A0ABY8QN33_9RHOB|nr:hypothetical protein [Tropicibacter oceani]WGW05431.1 hypothetical protein QF118_07755 [Tropicibacter oceani]